MYFACGLILNLAVILVFHRPAAGQSDCNGCCTAARHKNIDEPRRSINSVWKPGQTALCDRSLPWGWYRFTSFVGGEMPTSKVDRNRCGTVAPIWLKGPHPSVADGTILRKACINFFDMNNGCAQSFDIKIKNCGLFYVYYLRPTYSCAVAYCAGTAKPCPYGKIGQPDNCYDPPVAFDRDYLGEPTITYAPLDPGTAAVTLRCEVPMNHTIRSWKNITYHIAWYSEGSYLKTDVVCGTLPPDIREYDNPCPGKPLISFLWGLEYSLNRWISCNVTARYTTSPLSPWCIPKTVREPFFAGLKVSPTVLKVKECSLDIRTFTITPTIPIAMNQYLQNKYLRISFWLPKGIELDNTDCEVEMKDLQPITVRVIARCTTIAQATGINKVIIPRIEDIHSAFWNRDFHLPSIVVSIESNAVNIHSCEAYTDPHYKSLPRFDAMSGGWGSDSSFTFMGHGNFILYRNAERNFEVHTRQWLCGHSSATCNCGVALRDHNDVIEFNCCNKLLRYDHITPIRVKVRSKKRLAPGISITQTIAGFNSQYQVLFPSGVKVRLYRNSFGINVYLQTPRAKDTANETGLCLHSGESDIDAFGYKFRMEPGDSYFDRLPHPITDTAVGYNVPCSCYRKDHKGRPECLQELPVHFPNVMDQPGAQVSITGGDNVSTRKKRNVKYTDELTDEDFELFKRSVGSKISKRHKRSSSPKLQFSKYNATRYCMERISNTDVGKLCAKLGANLQTLVNSCSIDLELTGETSFAISAVSLLINQCGEIAGRNMSSYVNESSEEKPEVPSYLTKIIDHLCPNDCNFNGKCVNGTCVCNKEFTAKDCAISIYQKPDISMLQGDGLCDRRKRPCRKVTVMGNGFLNSTNMTCHLTEFAVINGSWIPNNTEIRLPGVMTDLVLADCDLPDSPVKPGHFHEVNEGTSAAGLVISMSNDGDHKSTKNLTFISYDSACMSCNMSTGCVLKNNSCFINGYCFAPNEPNPNDWCYQCLPDVSNSIWTKWPVNHPPRFTATNQYYALLEENLELAIDVSDPEGMPVTVSLMDGSPSEAVMRDNVLLWNVTNDANTQFFFNATDACHAVSKSNITVSLVACQCQNGSCVPHPNKPRGSGFYTCDCVPGFTGAKCDANIDDCMSYPCFRGRCIDGLNNFTCICDYGFVGRMCDTNYDDCSSSPCVHGNCTDYTGGYRCNCTSGFRGQNCTIDINECLSSPCRHGSCVDGVDSYTCQCQNGYTGQNCDVDIDECQSFPCVHGSCVDIVNNYTCNCNAGFTGPKCNVTIVTCTDDSCYPSVTCFQNNKTISCGPCPFGLTGDGKNCRDVDYCENAACKNGASCVDGISSYTCSCLVGFKGKYCETDIDDCFSSRCANGATCVDGVNEYSCVCQEGFTGKFCQDDIDDCFSSICANGATCVDGVNEYSCVCQEGFTGEFCQDVLERSTVPSSTTREEKLSSKPTTESVRDNSETETDFVFQIRVNKEWDERLRDKASEKFKEFSTVLKEEISKAYFLSSELKGVKIISMRPGSIVVDFKLVFKTKITVKQALAPLKRETADGKLGNLSVDPDSLKQKIDIKEDDESEQHTTNIPLIIGVSLAVFVIVFVAILCVFYHCKQSVPSRSNSRVGSATPLETGFRKLDAYELQPTKPQSQKVVFNEKTGVWSK